MGKNNRSKLPAIYDKRRNRSEVPDRAKILEALDTLREQVMGNKVPKSPDNLIPKIPEKKDLDPSQSDVLLDLVKHSLAQYGTVVPPREVFYMTGRATCPGCGHEGPIPSDFGFRTLKNGDVRPQSNCNKCRGRYDPERRQRRLAKQKVKKG